MTANEVKELLAKKHSDDVFVTECKTGSSHYDPNCQRLDAWVMNKSWRNAKVTGYEIKVSRNDFLRDDKWRGYLDYCNEFYFICPHGMIKANEIPDDIGLMWVAKTGTRVYTKKKAKYRDMKIPESIFRYILMCRVQIKRSSGYMKLDMKEYWEQWLKDKELDKDFGKLVSKQISTRVKKEIIKVSKENETLKKQADNVELAANKLSDMGIDIEYLENIYQRRSFEEKIKEIINGIPPGFEWELDKIIQNAQDLKNDLFKVKTSKGKNK